MDRPPAAAAARIKGRSPAHAIRARGRGATGELAASATIVSVLKKKNRRSRNLAILAVRRAVLSNVILPPEGGKPLLGERAA